LQCTDHGLDSSYATYCRKEVGFKSGKIELQNAYSEKGPQKSHLPFTFTRRQMERAWTTIISLRLRTKVTAGRRAHPDGAIRRAFCCKVRRPATVVLLQVTGLA
jgi:hypothetical protein